MEKLKLNPVSLREVKLEIKEWNDRWNEFDRNPKKGNKPIPCETLIERLNEKHLVSLTKEDIIELSTTK